MLQYISLYKENALLRRSFNFQKMPTFTTHKGREGKKAWVNENSKAYNALVAIVTDKPILKGLHCLKNFAHRSIIEDSRSSCDKYCPEGFPFCFLRNDYENTASNSWSPYNSGIGLLWAEKKDVKNVLS